MVSRIWSVLVFIARLILMAACMRRGFKNEKARSDQTQEKQKDVS